MLLGGMPQVAVLDGIDRDGRTAAADNILSDIPGIYLLVHGQSHDHASKLHSSWTTQLSDVFSNLYLLTTTYTLRVEIVGINLYSK